MRIGEQPDWARCPHCGIAGPNYTTVYTSQQALPRRDGEAHSRWAAYACTTCGSLVTTKGEPGSGVANPLVVEIYPPAKTAHDDIPEPARRFLEQAFQSIHAPDAAAMVAGSAVDAMLKLHGFEKGTLYARIDEAKVAGLLTESMADWAHEVRLGSNRPRHADKERPHVSPEEAVQAVEFAEALGHFLFVLTARIQRGIDSAKNAPVG